jgi:hypothetical protein
MIDFHLGRESQPPDNEIADVKGISQQVSYRQIPPLNTPLVANSQDGRPSTQNRAVHVAPEPLKTPF